VSGVINFIRHGESTWNQEGRLQGQGKPTENLPEGTGGAIIGFKDSKLLDSSGLTEKGYLQARELADKISGWFQGNHRIVFVSSDLIRCKQTTETLVDCLSAKNIEAVVHYDKRLREADHGRLSGLLESEYRQLDYFRQYKMLPPEEQFSMAMDPECGESYHLVAGRIHEAMIHYLHQFPEDEIYFVTHGGPMRAIYTYLTRDPAPFSTEYDIANQLKNCSVMKISNIHNAHISLSIEFAAPIGAENSAKKI
jgi:probable phosphoglycerate mutase